MWNRQRPMCCAVLGVLVGLAFSATAWGGPRDHENGFFLRLSAGGGAASSEIDFPGGEGELSGGAGDINFAIGGIVSPNLALHGTIFGWSIQDPDVTLFGMSGEADATVTLSALGGGVTYYVMPANVYLSGSLGFGRLSIDGVGGEGESDLGAIIDLTVGKEWWVGDKWGLGVAGAVGFHSVPEKGIDENWSGASFAIRFTATLN